MRFDVGFLACPAQKEPFGPPLHWQSLQFSDFASGKISPGDVLARQLRADFLHIHSEPASQGKPIDRQTARMGEVKLQDRIGWVRIERRLALIRVAEFFQ